MSDALDNLALVGAAETTGGYEMRAISGVIHLDYEGLFQSFVFRWERRSIPQLPPRTSTIAPAFLSGSATYWCGVGRSNWGNWAERASEARKAMLDFHELVLAGAGHPAFGAVLAFLRRPPPILDVRPDGNYIVAVDGLYPHELDEARSLWRERASRFTRDDPNPAVSLGGTGTVRLWSPPVVGAYGKAPSISPVIASAGAGLRRLLGRAAKLDQSRACIAWVDGDPDADPLPWLYPVGIAPVPPPEWRGSVNVAVVRARQQAKVHIEFFWRGSPALFAARLHRAYSLFRDVAAQYRPRRVNAPPQWPYALTGYRSGPLRTGVIRAICLGTPLPREILPILQQRAMAGSKTSPDLGLAAMYIQSLGARCAQ